jgi:membrane associated rhomboid family serine protease
MRIKYNAPVVLTFSILSTLILFLNEFLGGSLTPLISVGPSLQAGNLLAYPTLFTHVLGHANLEHLLGNLTFILLLGPIIEEKYGSRNTLFMFLITALITGLLNIFFFNTGLMGASGIVFMLILLVSFTNSRNGDIPLTFVLIAILFIGKEFINGLRPDNISQFAHIIGGVLGSIFGFSGLFRKRETY